MNQKRKQRIIDVLTQTQNNLMYIRDEEEEAMENIPESLQGSEQYGRMEGAFDLLNEMIECMEQFVENANNI